MKTVTRIHFFRAALAGVLIATGTAESPAAWETTLSLGPSAGESSGRTILIDPEAADPVMPNLFVGGSTLSQSGPSVLLFDQQDATDPVRVSDEEPGVVEHLGVDHSTGHLYAAGWTYSSSSVWRVRASSDGGAN
jgi:hypothetical protein